MKILLIILVILIVGSGGYYIWAKKTNNLPSFLKTAQTTTPDSSLTEQNNIDLSQTLQIACGKEILKANYSADYQLIRRDKPEDFYPQVWLYKNGDFDPSNIGKGDYQKTFSIYCHTNSNLNGKGVGTFNLNDKDWVKKQNSNYEIYSIKSGQLQPRGSQSLSYLSEDLFILTDTNVYAVQRFVPKDDKNYEAQTFQAFVQLIVIQ